jgi:hypothetical protein
LGRVRIAADTASPHASGDHRDEDTAKTHAAIHHAVAGTSLIGSSDWKTKIGLHAIRIDATSAVRGSAVRRART